MLTRVVMALALSAVCPAPIDEPIVDIGTPPVPTYPAKPPCTSEVIVLPSYNAETTCDVSPPQILAFWQHDPGPVQVEECLNSGGQPLVTRFGELCFDIDY